METEGGPEEQAEVRGNGPRPGDEMLERGGLGTFRVGPVGDLRKLVRIAEEDHRIRGSRHDAGIGQGELARLVHEQDVDGACRIRPAPEPRGPAKQVHGTGPDCRRGRTGVPIYGQALDGRLPVLPVRALADPHLRSRRTGRSINCLEQVADHLVRLGRDPDAAAGRDERDDHPGGRPRLARPRRPLDREGAALESEGDPDRGREGGLVSDDEGTSPQIADHRRTAPEDQFACRTIRAGPLDPRRDHVVGEAEERPAHRLGAVRLSRDQRPRMVEARGLEVERPRRNIEGDDRAGTLLRVRVDGVVARTELEFLGWIEPVAVDSGLLDRAQVGDELEVADRAAVRHEILGRGLLEPVVVPPLGLRLPVVPIDQPGQEPAGLLLLGAIRPVGRDTRAKRLLAGATLGPLGRNRLGSRRIARGRPRNDPIRKERGRLDPEALEPIPEPERRDAVVPVVVGDVRQDRRVLRFHPALVLHDAEPGARDGPFAFGQVELLDLLDRIRLDGRPDAAPHDMVVRD